MFNVRHMLLVLSFVATGLMIQPVASSTEPVHPIKVVKWAIQKTSTLRIVGQSNVNSFGCDIKGYYEPDTIYCSDVVEGKTVALNGSMKINILNFNCHNDIITADLRKTLKADQYPYLTIRFLSLDHFPQLQSDADCLKGCVEIELAGVCKRFQIDYSFASSRNASITLNGQRKFCFSDFKLTPPKKLAGLIKVKDAFDVEFQLVLDPIDQ